MAYFRGDPYIFDDGDHFHIWVRGRYDAHRDSGWGESDPEASAGVQVPVGIVDRLVLMRLAELLVEKEAVSLLDAFLVELDGGGNAGNIQLLGNAKVLRAGLTALEALCQCTTVDDLGWFDRRKG